MMTASRILILLGVVTFIVMCTLAISNGSLMIFLLGWLITSTTIGVGGVLGVSAATRATRETTK